MKRLSGRLFFLMICPSLTMLGLPKMSIAQSSICDATATCVLTWQQDNPPICSGCAYRTGQNLTESMVTYQNITSDRRAGPSLFFSPLCTINVEAAPRFAVPKRGHHRRSYQETFLTRSTIFCASFTSTTPRSASA
jgi:hypothetical protein